MKVLMSGEYDVAAAVMFARWVIGLEPSWVGKMKERVSGAG